MAKKREWESKYPDYPNLLADDRLEDCDGIFALAREGGPGSDLFAAAVLKRFASRVHAGEPVEQWIMTLFADTFSRVLAGAAWDDEIRLPGRELPAEWSHFSPTEWRDFEIYLLVRRMHEPGQNITDTIQFVADQFPTSFATARAAYYSFKARCEKPDDDSKKSAENLDIPPE